MMDGAGCRATLRPCSLFRGTRSMRTAAWWRRAFGRRWAPGGLLFALGDGQKGTDGIEGPLFAKGPWGKKKKRGFFGGTLERALR